MVPTLHSHPLASLCWKVTIALKEINAPFKEAIASVGDPDQLKQYAKLWAVETAPVLQMGKVVLADPAEIIETMARQNTVFTEIIPSEGGRRLETQTWDRICDNHLHSAVHKVIRARLSGEADPQPALDEIITAYQLIEKRMAGRQWIGVGAFSMADCSAAPGLWFADQIVPLATQWPHARAYLDRLVERPSFAEIITMAAPYVQLFPQAREQAAEASTAA